MARLSCGGGRRKRALLRVALALAAGGGCIRSLDGSAGRLVGHELRRRSAVLCMYMYVRLNAARADLVCDRNAAAPRCAFR